MCTIIFQGQIIGLPGTARNLQLRFYTPPKPEYGTNSEGSHAWVLTRSPTTSKPKIHFWESLTGSKLDQDDPRLHRFYRTIDCVFSTKCFYANVQADNRVVNTSYDFTDEFMWKAMSSTYVNALPPAQGVGYLQASTLIGNVGQEEKTLEGLLRDKIGSMRMNDERLSTQWDSQLGYILGGALSNYELERVGGVTMGNEELGSFVYKKC